MNSFVLRLLTLFSVTCVFSYKPPLEAMSWFSKPRSEFSQTQIGVLTRNYEDLSRNRPVAVEIWYPTDTRETLVEPTDLCPQEVRGASLSEKRSQYPLILMSHGNRGDRRDCSWLAECLVRYGFVVASVEHFGNARKSYDEALTLRFWERARDISFTLDQLYQDPFLQEHIEKERIGFVGYSLGGLTGLSLAGATAQEKDLKQALSTLQKSSPQINAEILEKLDLTPGCRSYFDPRIRAVLLICPANFCYSPEALSKIQTPVGLVASVQDEVLPHEQHAYSVIRCVGPSRLKLFHKQVSHFAFLNRVAGQGKQMIRAGISKPEKPDPLHKEVGQFSVEFFQDFLNR